MYKEIFPERIKKARLDTGLTQEEVATELKIARTSISKFEKGQLEPDIEKLGALAEFYSVSTDWLLGIGKKRDDNTHKS